METTLQLAAASCTVKCEMILAAAVVIFIMENTFIIYNFYYLEWYVLIKKNISQCVTLETVSLNLNTSSVAFGKGFDS